MKSSKELRLTIDTCINSIKLITPSREVSLAHTNLQRAKMWLGEVLRVAGDVNPYPKANDASSPVIEKQAEHTETTFEDGFKELPDQTAKVKFFRFAIQGIIDEMNYSHTAVQSEADTFLRESYLALIESRMWFGGELNRIFESQKEKQTA